MLYFKKRQVKLQLRLHLITSETQHESAKYKLIQSNSHNSGYRRACQIPKSSQRLTGSSLYWPSDAWTSLLASGFVSLKRDYKSGQNLAFTEVQNYGPAKVCGAIVVYHKLTSMCNARQWLKRFKNEAFINILSKYNFHWLVSVMV